MTMDEIVDQIAFDMGIPSNINIESEQGDLTIEKSVIRAFIELKRYIKTPENKTVPFSHRIDLIKNEIYTKKVLNVAPAYPKVGLQLSNVDSGNVFQLAAAVNYGALTTSTTANMDPVITQLAMAQVSNTLAQDFQWSYSSNNQCVYVTCKAPEPGLCTVRYVPDYKDVSEINNDTWLDYLIRLATAHMKLALGRSRSKYKVPGSNIENDGETLLTEANAELEQMRSELQAKKNHLVVVN